ncbi:MAG TPA: hypothetical protein VMS32_00650 [Verrucomicrobiae bacterium]|jgi:hypothetical protein|nr:hypothetical protein [Verrucomicrobiae bacterium]
MIIRKLIAGITLAAVAVMIVPAAPVRANGAASTRNILLLGAAAATYLIIQHNRQVHAREAAASQQQAATAAQAQDAWAALAAEKRAYNAQVAENQDLQREVAYQHSVVLQQQRQLASTGGGSNFVQSAAPQPQRVVARTAPKQQLAMVSYGWGTL